MGVIEDILRIKNEASAELQRLAKDAGAATDSIDRNKDATRRAELAYKQAAKELELLTSEEELSEEQKKQLAVATKRLEVAEKARALQTRKAAEETAEAAKKEKEAADEKKRLAERSRALAKTALGVGAAMVAAAASVFKLAQRVADARNEITDFSTRTGIATDTLSGLKLAAQGSGLQLSSLEGALQGFPKRLSDFANNTGEAKRAFEALGVSATDSSGNLRESDDVLKEVIGRIQEIPNATTQAALATQLFGESGGRLLQALGGQELQDFIDRAKAFGVDVGPQAAESARKFQRAMADLNAAVEGAGNRLSTALGEDFVTETIGAATSAIAFFGVFTSEVFARIGRSVELTRGLIDALFSFDLEKKKQAFKDAADFLLEGNLVLVTEIFDRSKKAAEDAAAAFVKGQDAAAGATGDDITFRPTIETEASPAAEFVGPLLDATKRTEIALMNLEPVIHEASEGDRVAFANTISQLSGDLRVSLERLPGRFASSLRAIGGQALGGAGQGLSALAGGPGGLLSTLGPVGAVAGGLASVGAQGAAGIRQQFEGFRDATIAGLEALPEIFQDIIPDFVGSLVDELVPALVAALPDIILTSVKGALVDIPAAIAEALGRVVGLGDSGGRVAAGIATLGLSEVGRLVTGGFQDGGRVDQTGLALVHQGEVVLNEGQQRDVRSALRGGGMGINFVNNGIMSAGEAADELGRLIDQRFGAFGGGRSDVLGGGT